MVQKAQTMREKKGFLEGKHKNIPRQLNKDQFNLYHN